MKQNSLPLCSIVMALLLVLAGAGPIPAAAQDQPNNVIQVTCPDADALETCQVEPPTANLTTLFQLAESIDPQTCRLTDDGGAVCPTAGGDTLVCSEFSPTSATCRITGGAIIACDRGVLRDEVIVDLACTVTGPPTDAAVGLFTSVTDPGTPQRQVATVIGTVCPQGVASPELQRDCNAVAEAIMGENPDQAGMAITQVTPLEASAPVDASQTSVAVQSQNLAARMAALRGGVGGFSFAGLGFDRNGQRLSAAELARQYGAEARGGAAAADDAGFGRLGVFVNGTVIIGDQDASINESGFDFDTTGITLGLDYRFTNTLAAGLALGYMTTDTDFDGDGGKLDSEGFNITLYSTWYPTDRFYLEGSVGYGGSDHDQERTIRYTLTLPTSTINVDQTATADFLGDQLAVVVGGGYEFRRGSLTFGPLAQLQYLDAEVDGYRERVSNPAAAGSGWALRIDDQQFDSLTLSLGGQASYALSQSWGVLSPQLRVEWIHEFQDDGESVTGRFIGDSSATAFSLATDDPDSDYFNLGVGLSAVTAGGLSGFVFYQRVLGFEDLDHNTVNAGVRWEF